MKPIFINDRKKFLSFEEVREFVIKLKFKNLSEWISYSKSGKRPNNIPSNPHQTYKNNKEWKGYGDFLGTENIHPKNMIFLSFEEAKKFVIKLKFRNVIEWKKYSKSEKKPNNIPSNPYTFYKNKGWTNWREWLGKEETLPFREAKKFVRKLKLKTEKEWQSYSKSGKRPNNIPSSPYMFYKNKGWTNWRDWLGKSL